MAIPREQGYGTVSNQADQLRATLGQLHEQLLLAEPLDPEVRRLLEGAVADIESALNDAENSNSNENAPVADRLTEAANHFEEAHPVVANTLTRLIDTLGQMGI